MNAGVSSRGSPTPKSMTWRPSASAAAFRRSSSSNGYGSDPRRPGDRWTISPFLSLPLSSAPPGRALQERAEHLVRSDQRGDVDPLVVPVSVLRVSGPEVHGVDACGPELRDGRPRLLRADGEIAGAPKPLHQRVP